MLRHQILIVAITATVVVVFLQPPIPQSLDYHVMADQRPCLGIPNCLNVLSNIPFAIVGVVGLALTFRRSRTRSTFVDEWERRLYEALFVGVTATAFGSSYYHLAPDNARLVWDRLPMTVGFMGLLTALVAERVSFRVARFLLWPLIALGLVSVFYWHWTELQGAGDLRLYVVVQFGSLLIVALMLALYPARYSGAAYVVIALIAYAAAKLFELADQPVLSVGNVVSGHTLKHLTAAAAVGCLTWWLHVRQPFDRTRTASMTHPV